MGAVLVREIDICVEAGLSSKPMNSMTREFSIEKSDGFDDRPRYSAYLRAIAFS